MSYNFSPFQKDLDTTIEWLQKEYSQISAGRANPGLLDSIMVESYGMRQPIKSVASINKEDARTLRIMPWDRATLHTIEIALRESGLPLSISVDSEGVRASVPMVTEENKKQLVKLTKDKLEDARITVRNHRKDVDKDIDASDLTEDEKRSAKDDMQKRVDATNKKLEDVFHVKEQDIMTV